MAEGSSDLSVGELIELQVDGWAAGGQCVARHRGRVVFVRHALPAEHVRARVTEVRRRLARAEVVEVLVASPDRVQPPCAYAGPGGCGGCDFQHVAVPAQRTAKAAVVVEQLTRLGGLSPSHPIGAGRLGDLQVQAVQARPDEVAEDTDGLGWRTRVRFAVDDGRAGLRRYRSHDVLPVDQCLLAYPGVDDVLRGSWPGVAEVESIVSGGGDRLVVLTPSHDGPSDANPLRAQDVREQVGTGVAVRVAGASAGIGRGWVRELVPLPTEQVPARVSGSGFWQVHPGAPGALVSAVLEQLEPQPGDALLDLYGGVGLFSLATAPAVTAAGSVTLIEGDQRAVRDARRNLHAHRQVRCVAGHVEHALADVSAADLVVLDPPRTGAGRLVIDRIAALRPRRISYVACDPAALARDAAYLRERGYLLDRLEAFDLFPMTRHVECVARFVLAGQ